MMRFLYHAIVPKPIKMLAYRLRRPDFRFREKLDRISRNGIEEFLHKVATQRILSGNVLEIGAGGRNQNYQRFSPCVANYWRCDIRVWPESKLELICDCTRTPFKSQSVDAVICSEVLEHVFDSRAAIEEITRIVRPGGYLVLTLPFFYHLHGVDKEDQGDYWRFTPGNLKLLWKHDFELILDNRTHLYFAGDPFVVNMQMLWKRKSS